MLDCSLAVEPRLNRHGAEDMDATSQRATVVIEHVSAISDFDDSGVDDSWFVAAYLVHDRGKRERVTLRRCDTRKEASAALEAIWRDLTAAKASVAKAP